MKDFQEMMRDKGYGYSYENDKYIFFSCDNSTVINSQRIDDKVLQCFENKMNIYLSRMKWQSQTIDDFIEKLNKSGCSINTIAGKTVFKMGGYFFVNDDFQINSIKKDLNRRSDIKELMKSVGHSKMHALSKASFIHQLEEQGYKVEWNNDNILFILPNGKSYLNTELNPKADWFNVQTIEKQIHINLDRYIKNLMRQVHSTMDFVELLKNRYLFQTKYVMWSNFDMKKKDKNIAAYQMAAEVFNRLGIHEGTVFNYHQTRKGSRNYQLDLQALQYDILYGKQYVYGGENPFEATKMQLGIYPATLERLESIGNGSYYVYGTNFTAASRLEINKELQETQYISPTQLLVQNVELADGDQVSVATQSNSSTKKVLSRTDYLTYNEDNGELMSQENYQAKKSAKAMLERLKEQHAEQTEDDGQAAEETPTEETTPELSLTPEIGRAHV